MKKGNASPLRKIFSDKTSGSADILSELHEHLKREQKIIEALPMLVYDIKEQFKSFQNVQNYIGELEHTLIKERKLDKFFSKYDSLFENVYDKIFNNILPGLKKHDKIITLSNSRTVLEILLRLNKINRKLSVIVCESRPKFEGRILAKKLTEEGIPTELITEAMIYEKVQSVDCAMIGADAVLKNGGVINKTGSSLLALACKNFSKPFYVIASKEKFRYNNSDSQKEMPPEEIWRHHHKNILIKNYYFEKIDKELITQIISG
ncbi:MAG: hypothetical protein HYS25_11530 [Ignavibacteriales bacterium]|nr:hypothetical protein [Ignavibacteriales bacterium]